MKIIPSIFLIIFIFAIYGNTLSNGFVYDDYDTIVHNSFVKNWNNIGDLFQETYFRRSTEASYRPVGTLYYFINYSVWKLNPSGYHFVQIILHIINVLLIYVLANHILKNRVAAFGAAWLFSCHPVLTESVNCISYNEELLAALFFLLAFTVHIKSYRTGYLWASIFFLTALL